jgi:hypothetical protein
MMCAWTNGNIRILAAVDVAAAASAATVVVKV